MKIGIDRTDVVVVDKDAIYEILATRENGICTHIVRPVRGKAFVAKTLEQAREIIEREVDSRDKVGAIYESLDGPGYIVVIKEIKEQRSSHT